MSFTEAARQIAVREAAERITTIQSRNEAYRVLAEAESNGDTVYASALRNAIADRWPIRKAIDYTPKLEAANNIILTTLRSVWADTGLRRLFEQLTQGKIARDLFQEMYTNGATHYAGTLENLLTEATTELTKASSILAKRVRELTSAPTGTVEEQLLTETRAQREWARLRPQLDNISDIELISHVSALVPTATTPAARNVYAEELPAYLKARGINRLPDNFIADLIAESDPIALEADRAEARAAEFVAVVRYNVDSALELISADGVATLFGYTIHDIEKLEEGRNPRFITVTKANLTPIPQSQQNTNSALGLLLDR